MKVAVVHNLNRGGAYRRLTDQVAQLDADVTEFVLGSAGPFTERPVVVDYRRGADLLNPLLRPPVRYSDVRRLDRAWAEVARRIERWAPDVVFANPCRYLQAPTVLRHLRDSGIRTVYYCDEPWRAFYDPSARASINSSTAVLYTALRRWEKRLDAEAVAAATVLATNSAYSAGRVRQAYGRDAVVVSPVINPFFVPNEGDHASTGCYVLSVGTLLASKGHDLAIESLAQAGLGLPLIIVAPRPDEREAARLRGLAAAAGVDVRIEVGISDAELRQRYRDALVTLYLARLEPLGLVSLESQACGTPVIVSAEGGLPETVDAGLSGWPVPRSAAAVAQALTDLVAADRDAIRRAAIRHAQLWQERASNLSLLAVAEARPLPGVAA